MSKNDVFYKKQKTVCVHFLFPRAFGMREHGDMYD